MGRFQQAAHVDRDVPRAIAEPDPMARNLTTSLFGSSGRFE
jgi:hypothetical protein